MQLKCKTTFLQKYQIQKEISILQNKQSAFYLVKTGKQPALHKVAENHTTLYKKPKSEPTATTRQKIILYPSQSKKGLRRVFYFCERK